MVNFLKGELYFDGKLKQGGEKNLFPGGAGGEGPNRGTGGGQFYLKGQLKKNEGGGHFHRLLETFLRGRIKICPVGFCFTFFFFGVLAYPLVLGPFLGMNWKHK